MTDRLTAETARGGMRVDCAHTGHSGTVMRVEGRNVRIAWDADTFLYVPDRFIPADQQPDQSLRAILSERAPELLAALNLYRDYHEDTFVPPGSQHPAHELIVIARRIFADPEQPAPLPAMWCGADAFTEENDDGR